MRRTLFLALSAILLPGATALQDPDVTTLSGTDQPAGTIVQLGANDDRMTVPVTLGAGGTYAFVVDTGSERTVISRELARKLGLASGRPVTVTSMTEVRPVETVVIPELAVSDVRHTDRIEAPAYAGIHLGAPGLLGIDTLAGRQVLIDFESGQMTVADSRRRPGRSHPTRKPDEIVVEARDVAGQLIMSDAYYRGTRIRVLVDTGASITVANTAFLRKFGRGADTLPEISINSVTGGQMTARFALVQRVTLGGVTFNDLPVAFADVPPFRKLNLDRRPALILGMNSLRSFRRLQIDFANREIRFLLPRPERLAKR